MIKSVCVYCGSSNGAKPFMPKPRRRSAVRWCEADMSLVYGGGSVGLMGAHRR